MPIYEGTVIRPPSEADSLIIQATLGCTDNSCTFCPAYKNKKFRIKPLKEIKNEIEETSRFYPDTRKVFLADGDAITIPQKDLLKITHYLKINFKNLTRISMYASAKSLTPKSIEELVQLKANKLTLLYLGLESGDVQTYKNTKKFGTPKLNIEQCLKIKEAGIKLNTTIILGLGGKALSNQHAVNTAKILNIIQPEQIAALTLMIVKGTELYNEQKSGKFSLPDEISLLKELSTIISNLKDFKCLFFSNHASNYFPISARFPKDKKFILSQLNNIIQTNNKSTLRPEFFRAL